jgi:hypothetical protein
MYHVGFGDAFLVTVRRRRRTWRMLVDCGVHRQGTARPIRESVGAIIADLTAVARPGQPPHLDVVVATHHHQDHISGFAVEDWADVQVDEVWLPFVEDPEDREAAALRGAQESAARRLRGVIHSLGGPDEGTWPAGLALADALAMNCLTNEEATARLLGRGSGFRGPTTVRFLPGPDDARTEIRTGLADTVVHVLGPPRDPRALAQMEPPASVAWLELAAADAAGTTDRLPLFDPIYRVADREVPAELRRAAATLRLDDLPDELDEVVLAASRLEGALNNTSLFLVLDVAGTRLVFPGDAQHGAWQRVLDDPHSRALVTEPAFYKVGHHGSHNATPRQFVDELLGDGAYAMLPWGLVRRWADSIPKAELLEALAHRGTHVLRADEKASDPRVSVGPMWTELTLPVG